MLRDSLFHHCGNKSSHLCDKHQRARAHALTVRQAETSRLSVEQVEQVSEELNSSDKEYHNQKSFIFRYSTCQIKLARHYITIMLLETVGKYFSGQHQPKLKTVFSRSRFMGISSRYDFGNEAQEAIKTQFRAAQDKKR